MATTHIISTSNNAGGGGPGANLTGHSSSSSSNVVGVHYKVGKKIGEGSFGVIFEGEFQDRALGTVLGTCEVGRAAVFLVIVVERADHRLEHESTRSITIGTARTDVL